MQRNTIVISLMVVALLGVATYSIKQGVLSLEMRLASLNRKIFSLEESTSLLRAEWSYLREPQRLQLLAEKYLPVQPGRGVQIVSLSRLAKQPTFEEQVPLRLASAKD